MPRISLNLILDEVTERSVTVLRQQLAADGISVKVSGYRPHITLSVYDVEAVRVNDFADQLVSLVETAQPFPLCFGSLGIFPEAAVLFLAPSPSQALLTWHQTIVAWFTGPGYPALLDELVLPDRWTPHVTLASSLSIDQLSLALSASLRRWEPLQGRAIGVGMRMHPNVQDTAQRLFPRNP
jgi:2'-5' RNA ligase